MKKTNLKKLGKTMGQKLDTLFEVPPGTCTESAYCGNKAEVCWQCAERQIHLHILREIISEVALHKCRD